MSNLNVLLVTIAEVLPVAGRMSGPLPSAKTRKLLMPDINVWPATATSAKPSAAGNCPGSPVAGDVHSSNAPEQSAKLMIIDGVGPRAEGFVNSPWVNCSKETCPG